jgi:WD40 repeat protein
MSPSKVQTIKAFHTLNEESDYVRAIDYSYVSNTLFSATDNGIVRQWDVNAISLKAELALPIEVTLI